MHGDFTRWTHRPDRGYRSVLLQQGRVLLDADWNEQTEIDRLHEETRTTDVVGRSGGPIGGAGFAVSGPGGGPPAGAAWADLRLGAGRYYVDGILCTSTGSALATQPFLAVAEPAAGAYVAFLDVWTRQVTCDEDPVLREPALGGPDTSTRAQTVWQLRLSARGGARCSDLERDLLARTPPRLAASLEEAPEEADPCEITATGGYQLLENQLYRVQIHRPASSPKPPTFLWSRENGSVVARLLDLQAVSGRPDQSVLTLDREGRDEELSIRRGDLVELTSTTRELRGEPGLLATAESPVGTSVTITWQAVADKVSLAALGEHPIVRRWEGTDNVAATPRRLEGGIQVRFTAPDEARTGDYWLVPARTVRLEYGVDARIGTIEWPVDGLGNPLALPPEGPVHHTAPIALLTRNAGGWTLDADCRNLFPALTELITLDLAGGDGQEAMPGDSLLEPIRVVVRNGGHPLADAPVEFVVDDGGEWSVDEGATWTAGSRPVLTDDDGVAVIRWRLRAGGPSTQTLTIHRLDDHGAALDPDLVVTGRLSIASQVAWNPVCRGFAGTATVQAALGQLATTLSFALLGGDGQLATAVGQVLPQPVRVRLDSPCGPAEGRSVIARVSDRGLVQPADLRQPRPEGLTGPEAGPEAKVATDADGVATFWWQPGFDDEPSATLGVVADDVPDTLVQVGAQLVSESARPPGVHVVRVEFGDDRPFGNDTVVPAVSLASGIVVSLDGPVLLPEKNGPRPVVRVLVELPWPLGRDGADWAPGPVGVRTIELAGSVEARDKRILWKPAVDTAPWLTKRLWDVLVQHGIEGPILARFEIDGWAAISADDPRQHLNGHTVAISKGGQTFWALPSDDAVTGGRFSQWCWLTGEADGRQVVPDVTGLALADGTAQLERLGYLVDTVEEVRIGVRKGTILRTDPNAGTPLDPGETVVMVLAIGRLQRPPN